MVEALHDNGGRQRASTASREEDEEVVIRGE
jgi:hypothetical protein